MSERFNDYPVRHCSRCEHPLACHVAAQGGVWGRCVVRGCDCGEAAPGEYYQPRDIVPLAPHEQREKA